MIELIICAIVPVRGKKVHDGEAEIYIMSVDLDYCPFCGGVPELCKGRGDWYWIVCSCGVELDLGQGDTGIADTMENTITQWNTRA